MDERGRHRAGRHAAPKPPRKAPKRIGAVFSVASVGSVGVTGASSFATGSGSSATILAEAQVSDSTTMSIPVVRTTDSNTATLRAQAASRADNRTSLDDTAALNQASDVADPLTDTSLAIDATPEISATERRALAAVTSTTNDLDSVVAQAQDQATAEAAQLQQEQDALAAAENSNVSSDSIQIADVINSGSRVAPIQGKYRLTARFGQHGRLWSKGWHTGLDFQVSSGTPVVACESGTIISAGWAGAYGYRIEIQHADGYVSAYNHLSKIEVSSGRVDAGQQIALSGNTGHTTGPHMHLEVLLDGNLINPSTWLWGVNR
jgi:murein DD-endopeptidase MepM/ murein hydrolase activator NlpD